MHTQTHAPSQASKYLARVREVRARRLALRAALDAADADLDGALIPDDAASEAPSILSGFSIYTDATTAAPSAGAGSSSFAPSAAAPSTLGGRRAQPRGGGAGGRRQKKAKGGRKIKQGSPEEERALGEHLAGLGPPDHLLEEAGQITELLCALGHLGDAQKLQRELAAWQAEHAAAVAELAAMAAEDEALDEGGGGGGGGGGGAAQQAQGQQQRAAGVQGAKEVSWKWDVLRAV